jgi:hypothetical protein
MAKEENRKGPCSANDNGLSGGEPVDPRFRRIAEAIGRQLARAQGMPPWAAPNDKATATIATLEGLPQSLDNRSASLVSSCVNSLNFKVPLFHEQ